MKLVDYYISEVKRIGLEMNLPTSLIEDIIKSLINDNNPILGHREPKKNLDIEISTIS